MRFFFGFYLQFLYNSTHSFNKQIFCMFKLLHFDCQLRMLECRLFTSKHIYLMKNDELKSAIQWIFKCFVNITKANTNQSNYHLICYIFKANMFMATVSSQPNSNSSESIKSQLKTWLTRIKMQNDLRIFKLKRFFKRSTEWCAKTAVLNDLILNISNDWCRSY